MKDVYIYDDWCKDIYNIFQYSTFIKFDEEDFYRAENIGFWMSCAVEDECRIQ